MFLGNTKKSNLVSINRNCVFYFIWIRFCQEFIEESGGAQKKTHSSSAQLVSAYNKECLLDYSKVDYNSIDTTVNCIIGLRCTCGKRFIKRVRKRTSTRF